jgi:hypothetical protein
MRIKRRWVDRLISAAIAPVHRFRCEQFGCGWEGALRAPNVQHIVEPMLCSLTDNKLRRAQESGHRL